MSWKKNIFSCLMWAVYLLIVGTAMIFTGRVICDSFGMAEYFEVLIPAAYLLLTGALVAVLHRMAVKLGVDSRKAGKAQAWMEGFLVFVLFAAGMFLRWTEMQSGSFAMPDGSIYLEISYISADGQGIPQISHGAVYVYLWALRLCFMMLGNKAAAAVWLQIALQMLGVLLLHFAVRKMAGRIPAIMMVAFFMLTPYMVGKSLVLSPEMLYLLAFSFVLLFVSQGVKYRFGWEFWLAAGVMAAVMVYLDVAGFLLLPLILGVIAAGRPGADRKTAGGLSGCLSGFLAGIAGCIFADVMSSGKTVLGITGAWMDLYRWDDLQLSITLSSFDEVWLIALILCFMAWGIFSFLCGRGVDRFTVWIFCLSIAVLLQCLGIFTEEMNGFCYIFLFSVILAGLGIGESMAVYPAEEAEEVPVEETAEEVEEVFVKETAEEAEVVPAEEAVEEAEVVPVKETAEEPEVAPVKETAEEAEVVPAEEAAEETIGVPSKEAVEKTEGVPGKKAAVNSGRAFEEAARRKGQMQPVSGMKRPGIEQNHIAEEEKGMEEEKNMPESKDSPDDQDNTARKKAEENPEKKRKIEFLDNPLPLPKKHVKRVMDYKLDSDKNLDGYDIAVADDDDFDH